MQTDLKLCKNCKFYGSALLWIEEDSKYYGSCYEAQRTPTGIVCLVTGEAIENKVVPAYQNRYEGDCGIEGKFFELKVLK
jgi:hypothetical protein